MATSTKTYYSVTETAQMLRQALKQRFPGVSFSVKSKSYSGGASINVKWTDGPRASEVKEVTNRFEGATFDGSIDLKSHIDQVVMTDEGPKAVHFGADFIFENRHFSADFLSRVYRRACQRYGLTPRVNAIRSTSWGAELTDEAAYDKLTSDASWNNNQVRDAVWRMSAKTVIHNGLLVEYKD